MSEYIEKNYINTWVRKENFELTPYGIIKLDFLNIIKIT